LTGMLILLPLDRTLMKFPVGMDAYSAALLDTAMPKNKPASNPVRIAGLTLPALLVAFSFTMLLSA
jgi:hypothetical protein